MYIALVTCSKSALTGLVSSWYAPILHTVETFRVIGAKPKAPPPHQGG